MSCSDQGVGMFNKIIGKFKWKTAQKEEFAFWKGVLEAGYFEMSFKDFHNYRKQVIINYAERLGPADTYFMDKVIADIGCGPLGIPAFIKGHKVYGIDPLAPEYQKLYGEYMTSLGATYINCKGEKIKLPDNSCDCIFCLIALTIPKIFLKF
jgi:ubiquinone/menaquinone biosynthesis C-methylase UbiE